MHLRREGVLLRDVAAVAWVEAPAEGSKEVDRVHLALNATEAGLNHTHLHVGASSWRAGGRSGTGAPVAYTAAALEEDLDSRIDLPVSRQQ